MMINLELNIEKLREEFKEKRSLEVLDFLNRGDADRMFDFLNGGMDETWWSASFLAHDIDGGQPIHLRRIPRNEIPIAKMEVLFLNHLIRGHFHTILTEQLAMLLVVIVWSVNSNGFCILLKC